MDAGGSQELCDGEDHKKHKADHKRHKTFIRLILCFCGVAFVPFCGFSFCASLCHQLKTNSRTRLIPKPVNRIVVPLLSPSL